MKILVVSPVYYPDPFCVSDICEALAQKGHLVTVLTGLPKNDNFGGERFRPGISNIKGVTVNRVKTSTRKSGINSLLKNYFSFYFRSMRFVRKTKVHFDLVISFVLSPIISAYAARYVSQKQKIPHIHFCLDLWPASVESVYPSLCKIPFFDHFLLSISRKIYFSSDKIVVSSPSFTDYLKTVIGISESKIIYIPQPLRPVPPDPPTLDFSSKFNLVYAGNIGSLQMVENLVLAVKSLENEASFQVHIFGDGSSKDKVLKLIANNHLEKIIIFHGSVPKSQIESYCKMATGLFVSLKPDGTPVSKTLPNKLIAYLSFGKPIIAVMNGDGFDVANKAGGCIVSQDSTPTSIAKMISQLFAIGEEQRNEMGKFNFNFYKTNFDYELTMGKIEDLLMLFCSGDKHI